ncbi:hypothetical protein [Moritella sp. PE36]
MRYYEKLGLMRSITRKGLRRQYAPAISLRMSIISNADDID